MSEKRRPNSSLLKSSTPDGGETGKRVVIFAPSLSLSQHPAFVSLSPSASNSSRTRVARVSKRGRNDSRAICTSPFAFPLHLPSNGTDLPLSPSSLVAATAASKGSLVRQTARLPLLLPARASIPCVISLFARNRLQRRGLSSTQRLLLQQQALTSSDNFFSLSLSVSLSR